MDDVVCARADPARDEEKKEEEEEEEEEAEEEETRAPSPLLALPAELRIRILEFVFDPSSSSSSEEEEDPDVPRGLTREHHRDNSDGPSTAAAVVLDEAYTAPARLAALLACRQLHADGHGAAWARTGFVCGNPFADVAARLRARLRPAALARVRRLAVVADARHFRGMGGAGWEDGDGDGNLDGNSSSSSSSSSARAAHPFGLAALRLDVLALVLHRSSHYHYLYDFTADLARLLRRLRGVGRLVVVQNRARVKGSFKAWYNRLVRRMLELDRAERYARAPPRPELVWWAWRYDEGAQTFTLEARPPRPVMAVEAYEAGVRPLVEELRVSVEGEEWNPDPRSRNGF